MPFVKGQTAWNLGLTKYTDVRVLQYATSLLGHKGNWKGMKRPEQSEFMKGNTISTSNQYGVWKKEIK